MSRFSGKCDLADHVFGQGGYFDKDGNPVKFGQEGVSCYYSDEWLDFLVFKKKTNGTLYQHKNVKVNSYNKDDIKKYCKEFDYKEVKTEVADKRSKTGFRTETSYIYTYYGKEYTEKELNNHGGVYIRVEIRFDTLLDLIQYYPYLVSASVCDQESQKIYISSESFVDREFNDMVKSGYVSKLRDHYKKELVEHMRDVTLKYYNPVGHEITEEVTFDDNGIAYTSKKICDRFEISFDQESLRKAREEGFNLSDLKLIEANKIQIRPEYLGEFKTIKINYVEDFEVPKEIN